jgi:hypothetical protein
MNWQHVENLLFKAWDNKLKLLSSYIDVSLYKEIEEQIPDSIITIESVFSIDDIKGFNLEPYFIDLEIIPFIGTLGDTVICIGIGSHNTNKIFYFDFDFGCIPFGEDDLDQFISKLRCKTEEAI